MDEYDLTKGYNNGGYTDMHNSAVGAYYSVGEYWDQSFDVV